MIALQSISTLGILISAFILAAGGVVDLPFTELGITGIGASASYAAYKLVSKAQTQSYELRLRTHDEIVESLERQIEVLEAQIGRVNNENNRLLNLISLLSVVPVVIKERDVPEGGE
jgi:hypothetical protein